MSDGAESAVLGYMLPSLMNHWALSEKQLGVVGALMSLGQALGSLFWGSLSDSMGRRPCFLLSVGLTAVLGLLSAASPNLLWYCVLRFLTGFAIGGNLPLAIAIASESMPPRHRDRALVALHLFYEMGALASTGLALGLMPSSCEEGSLCLWRAYLLAVALPAVVILPVAAIRLPETPFWLVSRGRHTQLIRVLSRAQGASRSAGERFKTLGHPEACQAETISSTGIPAGAHTGEPACHDASSTGSQRAVWAACDSGSDSENAASVTKPSPDKARAATAWISATSTSDGPGAPVETSMAAKAALAASPSHSNSSATSRLRSLVFGRELRAITACICMLWLSADMASGWWTWTPTFASMQHVEAHGVYVASIVGRVVASAAFLVVTAIINHFGARQLLLLTLLLCTLLSGLLTVWTKDPALFASSSFVLVYGAFSLCFGGAWPIMYVVTPATFPTSVRGAGFGLASSAGKLGALIGPLVVGDLLAPSILRIGSFFTVMWAMSALALALAWRVQPKQPSGS